MSPPPPDPGPALLVLLALLLGLAFFSAAEAALFGLEGEERKARSGPGAEAIDALLAQPGRTLAGLFLGGELLAALLASVGAGLALAWSPRQAWLPLVLLGPLVLVLSELLPRLLGAGQARPLSARLAPLLRLFLAALGPVLALLTRLSEALLVLLGGVEAATQGRAHQARLLQRVEAGGPPSTVGGMQEEMLQRVFEFGDLTVSRLMTPRPDVVSLPLHTPWSELVDQIRHHGLSRIPIWQGRPDNIIGVLVVKDLLPHLATHLREAGEGQADPRAMPMGPRQLLKLLHPARFVPTGKPAQDMLAEFREQRFHLAMVVDEHGNAVGLVTLDDLLSELVGELLDEADEQEPDVTELEPGVFRLRGALDVDDFEARFGLRLPEGGYDTVAGFVLDRSGSVPELDAEIAWQGLRFRVSGLQGKRITELHLRIPEAGLAADPVDSGQAAALDDGGAA